MFRATVYIEDNGKIEKLSNSFESESERNGWIIDKLLNNSFSYLIVSGGTEFVNVQQS